MSTSGKKPASGQGERAGSRFRDWCVGTKPTDVLSVLMALLSVAIAGIALHKADQVAAQQEEASAPVLAPDTPPGDRGKRRWVTTEFARVKKRLDRTYLDRAALTQSHGKKFHVGRLVMPVTNGGAGIALTVGRPVLVQDCNTEPQHLPASTVGALGTYSVPSGGADQLGYLQRPSDPSGHVTINGKSYWWSFDYRHFGEIGGSNLGSANLVLWYTDGARRLLRWTCINYSIDGANTRGPQTEWAVQAHEYGTRPFMGGTTASP